MTRTRSRDVPVSKDQTQANPQPGDRPPMKGEDAQAAMRRLYGASSRYASTSVGGAAGTAASGGAAAAGDGVASGARPWIAIRWECCSSYSRIYRNPAGTAYAGQCPRCGRPISVRIGPGGIDTRFFAAG
ncbi:MAG: hypothetical protein AAGB29_08590 [Planctomycetota bacterium]